MLLRMTTVRMLRHFTGGRYDSQEWPGYRGLIDVPEWEATDLIQQGYAELPGAPELDRGYSVLKQPDPAYESRLKRLDGEEDTELEEPDDEREDTGDFDFDSDFERDDSGSEIAETLSVKRPSTVDLKAKWVEWAVLHGADEDGAASMTKAQLIQEYGSL